MTQPRSQSKLVLECPWEGVRGSCLLLQTSTLALLLGSGALGDKLGRRAEDLGSAGRQETQGRVSWLLSVSLSLSLRLCSPLTTAFWREQMDMAWPMTQLLSLALVAAGWGAQPRTPRARMDLLNVCMDAKHH